MSFVESGKNRAAYIYIYMQQGLLGADFTVMFVSNADGATL